MKRIHIDCSAGAAGDMLAAALLELHPDPDGALARLNGAGIPGVAYARRAVTRCGIAGTRLVVTVGGRSEGDGDGHGEAHSHRSLEEVLGIVGALDLPESAKADAAAVYRLLAGAEGRAHGCEVGEVHFHELGALDAVADIAAVCFLVGELGPDEITATPVNVGAGSVRCAHGWLPVPAPATAFLLEGIPAHADADSEVSRELCTPTGAALLRHFVKRYGAMPPMRATRIGHGAGSADFADRPNLVRCTMGEGEGDGAAGTREEEVCELVCNLDDMTGEEIAFAAGRIFAAGALDVVAIPATMKKGRPGVILAVLCAREGRDAVAEAVFRYTTTLGVRIRECRRRVLARREESVTLPDGSVVRRKVAEGPGGERAKCEYEDLARIAKGEGVGLREVREKLVW